MDSIPIGDAMRRVRYCLALLATIIGCESLPGMKVDNPVVGPPPPRITAPDADEQSEPDKTDPSGPGTGDKVAGQAVIEQVSAQTETVADITRFPLDPEFPDAMLVATVNSMPITVGDVLEPVKKRLEEQMEALRVPAEKRGEIRQSWVKQMLPAVIDRKLRISGLTMGLNDKQRKGLNDYLDKTWGEYSEQLRKERGVSTMQELAEDMKKEGTDLQRVKQHWRDGSMAHQFVLLKVQSTYEPDRKDLLDYYYEHKDEYAFTSRVKWKQIVVRKQKGEAREDAEARAGRLLEQLNAGGEFSELASKHSDGPTREKGGYWDWTESGSLACQDVEEFLFTAPIGSTSELISYKDEFHIVQILDRVEAGHRSFEQEQVQSEIRDALKRGDKERLARKAVEEMMKTAVIETVFGDDWKFRHPELEATRKGSRARS